MIDRGMQWWMLVAWFLVWEAYGLLTSVPTFSAWWISTRDGLYFPWNYLWVIATFVPLAWLTVHWAVNRLNPPGLEKVSLAAMFAGLAFSIWATWRNNRAKKNNHTT